MDTERVYIKNYDMWNHKKKELEERILPDDFFFLEGEVWWAMLGVNIGHEIDGKNELFERPILVFRKLDENLLIALPLTSKQKEGERFYTLYYKGETRTILLSQSRTISSKRLLRLIHRISNTEFITIQKQIITLCIPTKAIPSD
jgi:mRNA interferase MazF